MKLLWWAIILVGAVLLSSFAGFVFAVRPPRIAVTLRPDDYRLQVERVVIPTEDGLRLAGWYLPRQGAPAVILLHGYPAEKADLLPLASALAPQFALLLVDQRYFGSSEGHATTLGFRERGDLKRMVDFLESRGAPSVGVFGFSLGGAVAMLTAPEDSRIRAIVAYAPFSDLRVLGQELYGWMSVGRYPFVEGMLLWSRVLFGADITRPSPVEAAAHLEVPILLVHSRLDEQISFRHAERLRTALANNPKAEFDFMDRGRHGEMPAGFEGKLRYFFRRALGRGVST